jgi:hypothetical protein
MAVLLDFSQAWSNRMALHADTISFLDMGDYLIEGRWPFPINGLWNPLYSVLLGLTMEILKPSPYWEYPVATTREGKSAWFFCNTLEAKADSGDRSVPR